MDDLTGQIERDLEEIGRTHMPFGKHGPLHYPPNGVPIYDLPVEYLAWFAAKGGFPQGRLGLLLQMVHRMKVDGLDCVFDVLRNRRGGRTPLRQSRTKSYQFPE